MPAEVPSLLGVLSAAQVSATARSIAAVQEPSGAIPWSLGEHTDVWNHLEAAMALTAAGLHDAAAAAFEWVRTVQRADGSVPLKIVRDVVEDPSGETNMSSYLAVALWHHWLVRRDAAFVRRHWPAVRAGLDFACRRQLPFGGIAWSQEWEDGHPARVNEDALVAGSSSVYHSLRAGVALAELLDDPQPEWELAGGRLGHALRAHRDLFLDKSEFSMDWYYPVLGGAVRGQAGRALLESRWEQFVRPGLGILCVASNPWVTGAETAELAMALDSLGDHARALRLFADLQHLRDDGGRYWTGFVYPDNVNWPVEHTTYTAAAVILAADALSDTTRAADVMRGDRLARHFPELGLECGCAPRAVTDGEGSPDGVAGVPAHPA